MTADTRVHSESWHGRILPESHPATVNRGGAPVPIVLAGLVVWALSWIASHALVVVGVVIVVAVIAALRGK